MVSQQPVLSICIPTYNRCARVTKLVHDLLSTPGNFEVRVHVDGSNDDTFRDLSSIKDNRLFITFAQNSGKTNALLTVIRSSQGRFIMSFDDDDSMYQEGLERILSCCRNDITEEIGGFIFHLDDEEGHRVGTAFPVTRSNYIGLRSDHKVTGDKKEIVRADILKRVAYDPCGKYRRAPPSLSWSRIALTHDTLCFNESIGIKRYLAGGITSKIWSTKFQNAYPMHLLYRVHCAAYFRSRYKNFLHLLRSFVAMIFFGLVSIKEIGR